MNEAAIGSVSVTAFPGGFKTAALHEGDTVADAIERAGFGGGNWTVQVNATPASRSTQLENGDRITLTEQIKGN